MINFMNSKPRKGFTLIEILISISILMIVISMVSFVFINTLNYWRRGFGFTNRQFAARLVFSRMTDNISSLFLSIPRGIYCFGTIDEFHFISVSSGSSEGDLAEMGYGINLDDNTLLFTYQEKADFDFSTYDSKEVIAVKTMMLSFAYLDKAGNWFASWDSRVGGQQENQAPQAIKVYFGIENLDIPGDMEVFETVIELPISSKYP